MARKKSELATLDASEFDAKLVDEGSDAVTFGETFDALQDGPIDGDSDDGDDSGIADLESDMSSVLADLSTEPEEPAVTASQLAHVQGQLALVLGTVDKQAGEIKRLTSLTRQALEAIQMLHRNQERLAGEAVVSQAVPSAPALGLDPVQFEHPTPPQGIATTQHRRDLTEKDIAERNFKVNAARQKRFGTPRNG